MTTPSVTVVIPVYNRATMVLEAVRSAFATEYRQLEVIVVNDGSTDGSREVLERLQAEFSGLRLLEHPGAQNLGVSASRNLGLSKATGDYVCFLDSDDLFLPNRFRCSIPFLETNPGVDAVLESVEVQERTGLLTLSNYFSRTSTLASFEFAPLNSLQAVPMPGILLRRSSFGRCGLFNESKRVGEDYEMWLRVEILLTLMGGDPTSPVARVRKHDGNTAGYWPAKVELTAISDTRRWLKARGVRDSRLRIRYRALLYYHVDGLLRGSIADAPAAGRLLIQAAYDAPSELCSLQYWANLVRWGRRSSGLITKR